MLSFYYAYKQVNVVSEFYFNKQRFKIFHNLQSNQTTTPSVQQVNDLEIFAYPKFMNHNIEKFIYFGKNDIAMKLKSW